MPDAASILKSVFGYSAFRGHQEAVIAHVIGGGDALVLMPTGGGKSLCYQVPALCRPGVGVVISPLIALMRDQVEALRQLGVAAAALNSSLGEGEAQEIFRALRQGTLDLLYISPERLLNDWMLSFLESCDLALFAIDEAHCVSQWGHDFRPEYRDLHLIKERFPDIPRLALTATADEATRRDILERLSLDGPGCRQFVSGFDRPNIRYRVTPKLRPKDQLFAFLEEQPPSHAGIVYCQTRARVEEVSGWLVGKGFTALPYHAGLGANLRALHQDRFLKEEGVIVVATIAFGMGVDKPDVRFVAHLDLPRSLEAYYQETGRAGRDGLPSEAWMIYGMQDVMRIRNWIDTSEAAEEQKRIERRKLDALLGYCETATCRRQVLLSYFGDESGACGNCDTCLTPPQTFDGSIEAQKLLSCAYRTGQRFGVVHLIEVLVGADTDRIRQFGHDRVSTYGIGRDLSRDHWRSIARQLVAMGLLEVDMAGHGALRLGPDCRPVLRGERQVLLRRDAGLELEQGGRGGTKGKGKTGTGSGAGGEGKGKRKPKPQFDDPLDEALFEALRRCRRDLADEQGVPPYVIFGDTTLLAMVAQRPVCRQELATLPGVGARKLERYGEAFLEVIRG